MGESERTSLSSRGKRVMGRKHKNRPAFENVLGGKARMEMSHAINGLVGRGTFAISFSLETY